LPISASAGAENEFFPRKGVNAAAIDARFSATRLNRQTAQNHLLSSHRKVLFCNHKKSFFYIFYSMADRSTLLDC
jgi:hypothetical protein